MSYDGRKLFKLRNPSGGVEDRRRTAGSGLAGTLLRILAIGIAGGIAMVKGSQKLGEALEATNERNQSRRESRRDAYREEVRRIMESDAEIGFDTKDQKGDI